MECGKCGGLVTWRGPLSALTHTECESCGGVNCQVVEQPEIEDCGHCGGSGRMVRDADIGTDQECVVCDGTGKQNDF